MSNKDWIINLENAADEVAGICGNEVVRFILREHGARSIEDLNPGDYEEVFSELYPTSRTTTENRQLNMEVLRLDRPAND